MSFGEGSQHDEIDRLNIGLEAKGDGVMVISRELKIGGSHETGK